MQCKKCGAELHPEQKVCIVCGARTEVGGGFHVEEEPKGWRPTGKQIGYGVSGLVVLILLIVLVKSLHVDPPEKVADAWFTALYGRNVPNATQLVTESCLRDLQGRNMDLTVLSEEYYTDMTQDQGVYKVSAPGFRDSSHANIVITIDHPSGQPGREVRLQLAKQGRRWYVDRVM